MEIDNTRIQENDIEIVRLSLRMIDEHLDREKERGSSAEKRANVIITFIGIMATIILAFSKLVVIINNPLLVLLGGFFTITIIFLVKSIINVMGLLHVKQINTLSPDMVNDIQDKSINQAIAYEVKWKIWEYNKLVPYNSKKLYHLQRAQRNMLFCVFSVLILAIVIIIDNFITNTECWLYALQFVIVVLSFIFAIVSDWLMDLNGIWKKA